MANSEETTSETVVDKKKKNTKKTAQPDTFRRDAILADVSENQRKGNMAKSRIEKIKEGKL